MQTTTPTSHQSVFLQAGCPSWRPTNSVKALKAINWGKGRNITSARWHVTLCDPMLMYLSYIQKWLNTNGLLYDHTYWRLLYGTAGHCIKWRLVLHISHLTWTCNYSKHCGWVRVVAYNIQCQQPWWLLDFLGYGPKTLFVSNTQRDVHKSFIATRRHPVQKRQLKANKDVHKVCYTSSKLISYNMVQICQPVGGQHSSYIPAAVETRHCLTHVDLV